MKNQDSSDSNIYTYHILVMTLSASVFGIVGSVTKNYVIAFIALIPYIISAFAINRIRKAEQNSTNPNTPVHKENQIIPKNESVKQSCSPNMSEVEKLINQVESIKKDFKIINYEVNDSIFNQFNLLKKNLDIEYVKINWQENTSKEISEKYQTVIDSYVEAMNNEYLKIKQQFTDILNNEIKSKIDNVEKQFN